MVNFISLLLFSISTNLDNIPVGISYSLNNKKIKFKDIFKISFFTSLITFIIMIIGTSINHILSLKFANTFGSTILIFIGIYGLLKEYINYIKNNDTSNDEININFSNIKTIFLLSINNFATGLSASIAGLNYLFSTVFTFIFSIIFLYLGYFIASKINNSKLSNYSNYLSSAIILLLGIIELIFYK